MPSARLMNFLKVMCETFDHDQLSYIGHCIGSGGEREECCDQKSQQNVIKSRPELGELFLIKCNAFFMPFLAY